MSAMDLEARIRARWAERMASPSAFNFDSLTSDNQQLSRYPSLSVDNSTAWGSYNSKQDAKIPSPLTNNGEISDTRLKTQFPSASCSTEIHHNCASPYVNGIGDSGEESRSWNTEVVTNSQHDRERKDNRLRNLVLTKTSSRSDNNQDSEDVCGNNRLLDLVTQSCCSSEQNTGFRTAYSSDPRHTGPIHDVPAGCANNKTESTKSEKGIDPCQDPRFHCRPKVPTGKPKSSPKHPQKKEMPHLLRCDEKFECEALPEDQASTERKWKNCPKNPNHMHFCPVKEFSRDKLPKGYRRRIYEEGIKSVADLTVRIKVKYNSNARTNEDKFARYRGTQLPHTGSGFIHARLFTNSTTNMEFPDNFTGELEEDGVENDLSAKYDRKNYEERVKYILEQFIPEDKKDRSQRAITAIMKIPRGLKDFFDCVSDYNYLRNSGDFDGVFDDNDDFNRLYGYKVIQELQKLDLRDSSHFIQRLPEDVQNSKFGRVAKTIFEMKELWFGPLYERRKQPKNKCEKAYKMLSRFKRRERAITGVCDGLKGFRFATFPPKESDYVFFRNDDEDEEEDVNDPENVQSEKDMKDTAETSSTFENDQNDDDLDSGESEDEDESEEQTEDYLNEVFEIVRPCPCQKCTDSRNPQPKGYSVNVLTARHVVYDKDEAQKTVVDLFCDNADGNGVETLSGVDVHVSSSSGDFAILMCATHDDILIRKLQKMIITMTRRIEDMKAKSNTPLAVICSHPHGHFKHITVGEWTTREIYRRRDALPPLWTSYLYNTPTCPGSSGAPVLILGHKSGTLSLDSLLHPHHGHEEDTLNRSSRLVSYYRKLENMSPKARQRVKKEQDEVYNDIVEELKRKSKEEMSKLRQIAETVEGMKIVGSKLFKR